MAFSYQWKANGIPIAGATGSTYVISISDYGKVISCDVTNSNSIGSTTVPVSNPLTLAQSYPINTAAPSISGTATVGLTLTVTNNGSWTGLPTITYTYVWRRNGVDIPGATSNSYTLLVADRGATITCMVRAANRYGWGESISNSKGPVA